MSLAIFQQCRASKRADTTVAGCPPTTRPDTSNNISVSVTDDVIPGNDTGDGHHTSASADDDVIRDRHCYIRY